MSVFRALLWLSLRSISPRVDPPDAVGTCVSPLYDIEERDASSESTEFCLDLAPGTDKNPCDLSAHFDVGEEMLWGEVGRLSLLSNDSFPRGSGIEDLLALLLWLALLCKTVAAEDALSVLEEVDSSCEKDGELGIGRRGTASGTISCGGLVLLTAEVSIVIVGLIILTFVSM